MAYNHLDRTRDEIRLLRLPPKYRTNATPRSLDGLRESKIFCTLERADLRQCPPFEALSYAWGDCNDTLPILLDGFHFQITRNLYSALENLQYEDKDRLLWIDALCINQLDVVERNDQVGHMHDIYSIATRVIVWLAEASERHLYAMDLIELMARDKALHILPSLEPHVDVHGMDLSSSTLRSSLVSFFELPWWWRVWTVQEFVLGGDVVFECGTRILSESSMTDFLDNLKGHVKSCCRQGHHLNEEVHHSNNSSVMSVKNRYEALLKARKLQGTERFLELLAMFRIRESTDPRDKIYGLLGMADTSFTRFISPDYALSVEELYKLSTFALIKWSRSLDVFSHLHHSHSTTLPSFVPDWRSRLTISHSKYMFRLSSLHLYNASGSRKAEILRRHQNQLHTSGVLFDKISTILPGKEKKQRVDKIRSYKALALIDERIDSIYCNSKQTVGEAFARTLFGDLKSQTEGLFVDRRLQTEDLALIEEWQSFNPKVRSNQSTPVKNLYRMSSVFDVITGGRKFACTERGYFGFTPPTTKEGDLVAVLPGGKVPYILRSVVSGELNKTETSPATDLGKCYVIVGDSYIHGIMDGEAFEWAETNANAFQGIVLY